MPPLGRPASARLTEKSGPPLRASLLWVFETWNEIGPYEFGVSESAEECVMLEPDKCREHAAEFMERAAKRLIPSKRTAFQK